MRPIAVVGFAFDLAPLDDGRSDAELLGPVVDRALSQSGLGSSKIDVVGSASSEFLNGVVGGVMGAFDALPGWPPRTHFHHEGDGAFALYECWVRLLAGDTDAALACAFSRPRAVEPARLLAPQLDPYLIAPLAPSHTALAALQAAALLDSGTVTEVDLARVVAARRPGFDGGAASRQPYVASPLRVADCSTVCSGAAAVVLASGEALTAVSGPRAWVTGMDQRVERQSLGARDLSRSGSITTAALHLGLAGTDVDLLECHAPYSHQELLIVDAIGARRIGQVNPSGGCLPADPVMATGLIRMGLAAEAVIAGKASRAVGHATNGVCLQHNLLGVFEANHE